MSRPLKITIAQGAFLPVPPIMGGAVEKAWFALGRAFASAGHDVTHVGRQHTTLPNETTDAGVRYLRVPGATATPSLWRLKLRDLRYSLRVQRRLPPADILVTNTFWLPALERRRSRGIPYVHVARYPKGQLRLYPQRAVLQTVSEPIRAAIEAEVGASERVRVVPYPLAPVYLSEHVTPAPTPTILYTGRVHPEKGVHLLVEAFARLHSSGLREWTLRIVGPWETAQGGGGTEYRAQLERLARAAGGAIALVPPIFDEAQLAQEYRRAAIFCYPSLADFGETFGLAVLEAMGSGAAPIVSGLACFRDFVRPEENGLIFDQRSPDPVAALAAELLKVVRDPELRDRLRLAAWSTARAYALPVVAQRYLDDFFILLANQCAKSCPRRYGLSHP